jgi:hypothetical protein
VPVFGPDTPVLRPAHVEYRGTQRWLLWPVLRYRVVSPVVRERGLNAFQEAVLGLARSGLREPDEMGAMLSLDPVLVNAVQWDLKGHGYLDRHWSVTETGRAALRDGFLDPSSNIVTHVYQDPFTGALLPGATILPEWARSERLRPLWTKVHLGTEGAPLNKNALTVPAEGVTAVDPPSPEQIVETVSAGAKAGRSGDRARKRWATSAPDRVISRVSLIGQADPAYLPLVLLAHTKQDTPTWSVHNTLIGRDSKFLRRQVAVRAQRWEPLRSAVEKLVGRTSDSLLEEYDRVDVELRRKIVSDLELRFTSEWRGYRMLVELLTLLERDYMRARRRPGMDAELGLVVQRSWQVHEFVLRELAHRHLLPATAVDQLRDPLAPFLGRCCRTIGLPFSEHAPLRGATAQRLRNKRNKPANLKAHELIALNLISAAHTDDHPFRDLVPAHRNLLTAMLAISQDRNSTAHADLVPLNPEYAESARHLARDTVAVFLGVPLPAKESTVD